LAKAVGFEGVDPEIGAESSAAQIREALEEHDLRIGGAGLPVEFRQGAEDFEAGLEVLEKVAPIASEAGSVRFYAYILSFSDDVPWKENFALHAERLGRAAQILDASGCRLGLEYLGPKTLRDGHQHEFIHTMEQMLELCEAVGPNSGLLVDSWHWHTSRGTVEELKGLTPELVVYVHINDAPDGVALDEHIDNERALHGETGVIDLAGFLGALRSIGYDGPVTPEPFISEFASQPAEEVLKRAGAAFDVFWE
jgi:sugar phosphate isomerase/epimerase